MGMFGSVDFSIDCENEKSAEKVLQTLNKMKEKGDIHNNFQFAELSREKDIVYGSHCSSRIQNLEWQCEQVWDEIEPIEGVIEAWFPIMIETEGFHFTKLED